MEIPESVKQRNILPVAKFQPLESLYNDDKHSADNGQASRKRKQLSNKRDHRRLSLPSVILASGVPFKNARRMKNGNISSDIVLIAHVAERHRRTWWVLRGHSMTSSARASSDGGTMSPSAFAVLRLMTSSYFVGACTGRSAGFSPLRMRST